MMGLQPEPASGLLEYRPATAVLPAAEHGYHLAKRATDLVAGLFLAGCLLPFFGVVALLIKLTDGGPVLFWQQRVGRNRRLFWMPKFRSMVPDAEARREEVEELNHHGEGAVTFKLRNDPRITWIGRIIRKCSLDEAPQLWCVLVGQMTLVGPRPPLPKEVADYHGDDFRRLDVTPGLTCIWQVSGRGDLSFERQVQMDIEYIETMSYWTDVKLLFRTVPAVLFGRGAY